jgi:hypothetical protein
MSRPAKNMQTNNTKQNKQKQKEKLIIWSTVKWYKSLLLMFDQMAVVKMIFDRET